MIPSQLTITAFAPAVDDTATNIVNSGDQQMDDHVGDPTLGVVRVVQISPSGLVAAAVVLVVNATAANNLNVGDQATAAYASEKIVVAVVHTPTGTPMIRAARLTPAADNMTHVLISGP